MKKNPETIGVTATRGKFDEKLLEALAEGRTQAEAAEYAGCASRTIRRRLNDPFFRLELEERKLERVRRNASTSVQAAATALASLEAQCLHRDPWLAQKAAAILLDHEDRRQEREIEERLCALEERLGLRLKERGRV